MPRRTIGRPRAAVRRSDSVSSDLAPAASRCGARHVLAACMTVVSMAKRYFMAAVIAATVCSLYLVGVGSHDAGASVSNGRSSLRPAGDEGIVLAAPKATPVRREETAKAAPASDVPPPRAFAVREPPPDVEAPVPVAPVPRATEEALAAMRRTLRASRMRSSYNDMDPLREFSNACREELGTNVLPAPSRDLAAGPGQGDRRDRAVG